MSDELDAELEDALERMTGKRDRPRYQLTRAVLLRGLGFIYAISFWGAVHQLPALIGDRGLLPASLYLDRLREAQGAGDAFLQRPTLFFVGVSDGALLTVSVVGCALGVAVLLGVENALVMATLWVLYLSVVHVGQIFYGYGWEILLLEAGFLAIFLAPLRSLGSRGAPPPSSSPRKLRKCRKSRFARTDFRHFLSWRPLTAARAPEPVIWLYRWLAFRVMFGAGLIKIRGDECWRELTCLTTHYETQPIPNPVSWWLHHRPLWFHQSGVLFNHFVELIVPFFFFGPWWLRWTGGALTIAFQLVLVISGNLSFLNWLTIVVSLSAFDDRLWERAWRRPVPPAESPTRARRIASWGLVAVVALLSIDPVMNLLSFDQLMNSSFDRLHLVNTYGAFGSVNRTRYEVIVEGTMDDPEDPDAEWREYELPCKPGDPTRRPCVRAPYHDRLDWQMWFAAFRAPELEPWIAHLVLQVLRGEGEGRTLFSHDPFGGEPPRAVRVSHWRYEMTDPGEPGWWRRERIGDYLRPLTLDDPELAAVARSYGWDQLYE